jgi:hypothetical protein
MGDENNDFGSWAALEFACSPGLGISLFSIFMGFKVRTVDFMPAV